MGKGRLPGCEGSTGPYMCYTGARMIPVITENLCSKLYRHQPPEAFDSNLYSPNSRTLPERQGKSRNPKTFKPQPENPRNLQPLNPIQLCNPYITPIYYSSFHFIFHYQIPKPHPGALHTSTFTSKTQRSCLGSLQTLPPTCH